MCRVHDQNAGGAAQVLFQNGREFVQCFVQTVKRSLVRIDREHDVPGLFRESSRGSLPPDIPARPDRMPADVDGLAGRQPVAFQVVFRILQVFLVREADAEIRIQTVDVMRADRHAVLDGHIVPRVDRGGKKRQAALLRDPREQRLDGSRILVRIEAEGLHFVLINGKRGERFDLHALQCCRGLCGLRRQKRIHGRVCLCVVDAFRDDQSDHKLRILLEYRFVNSEIHFVLPLFSWFPAGRTHDARAFAGRFIRGFNVRIRPTGTSCSRRDSLLTVSACPGRTGIWTRTNSSRCSRRSGTSSPAPLP